MQNTEAFLKKEMEKINNKTKRDKRIFARYYERIERHKPGICEGKSATLYLRIALGIVLYIWLLVFAFILFMG